MAHVCYENKILSSKLNDILSTKVDLNQYMTVDTTLAESAGMKKVVNVYTSTGDVEALGMGEGNSAGIEVNFTAKEYEVKTYQGKFSFYDEQEMKDPMIVDAGLTHSGDIMTNKWTQLAIAEMDKATLTQEASEWGFEVVVDAIAKMNIEDESGLFLLISPAAQAEFRKALGENLKYAEGFVRTGYIGSVCGVPVIVSKAVPAGKAFLATKEAVTVFIKKDTETEYDRDKDIRENTYYVRKVGVVALTNENAIVKIVVA